MLWSLAWVQSALLLGLRHWLSLLSSGRITAVIQPELVRTPVQPVRSPLWDSPGSLTLVSRFKCSFIQLLHTSHCLPYDLFVSCVYFTSLTRPASFPHLRNSLFSVSLTVSQCFCTQFSNFTVNVDCGEGWEKLDIIKWRCAFACLLCNVSKSQPDLEGETMI